jgi:hypothetical protein
MRPHSLSGLVVTIVAVACATPPTPTATPTPTAAAAPAPAVAVAVEVPSPLVGSWELVSTRMMRGDSVLFEANAPAIRSLKILNTTHWSVVTVRGDQFLRAATGHYRTNGSTYVETMELASGRFTPGRQFSFQSEVVGDNWTIDGGEGSDRFHEVWHRLR